MRIRNIFKSNQEQATAAWIQELNNIRINDMIAKIADQNINLENAMDQINYLKAFVNDPEHILGSKLTKHGEIAEHVQVRFVNANKMIVGKQADYTFDGVGRTAMEDYLKNGKMIQSKFYNGEKGTFNAIVKHLDKYPKFIKNGGSYDISKDQYEKLIDIYNRGETARSTLRRSEETLFKHMKEWEAENNIKIKEVVHPTEVNYQDVQLNNVDNVIDKKENELNKKNENIKKDIQEKHQPSLKEGVQATAIAAALEGGTTFCLKVFEKRKGGKKLADFTADDWKDVGIDTAKGTVKGAIRGGSLYAMTNFLNTPAPVANSLVTASFGVAALARKLENDEISEEEFIMSSEVVCLDVSMSALSATLGQTLIPIPVVGAIVGNTVGTVMLEISKNYLNKDEQKLIEKYTERSIVIDKKYENEYNKILNEIQLKEKRFNSLVELAFDPDVNKAFDASIELAINEGVNEDDILKNLNEINVYFNE